MHVSFGAFIVHFVCDVTDYWARKTFLIKLLYVKKSQGSETCLLCANLVHELLSLLSELAFLNNCDRSKHCP